MSEAMPFQEVERTVLYDEVSRHIKQAIVDGTYQPGDRLPSERDLAEAFGVGRPTVREALKILAMQGLVNMERRQSGYIVRQPDIAQYIPTARNLLTWLAVVNDSTIGSLLAVVPYMRSMIAHNAIPCRTDELIRDLDEIIVEMENGEQSFAVAQPLAYAFTLRLAEATGNGMMIALWRIFQDVLCSKFPPVMASFEPEGPARFIAYHKTIADAVDRASHEDIDRAIQARRDRIRELEKSSQTETPEK